MIKLSKHQEVLKFLRHSSNVWYLAEGMFGPLFAVFAGKLGGDILDVAWAWGLFLLVNGILIVVVGRISDKLIKRNTLMVIGYALNAVFTFAYLFVGTPFALFAIQIGLGFASALATPTWDDFYAEVEEKLDEGANAWGLAEGEKEILMGLGLFAGGFIVSRFSFELLFVIMGVLQTVATILVIICVQKSLQLKPLKK